MADKDKRTLFRLDSDDLADALEAIYKRQKSVEEKLGEIQTALLRMQTVVVAADSHPGAAKPDDDGVEDGIPPIVKWALQQPWGVQLMHTLTDQQMISGLVGAGVDWLKKKAVEKATS